MIHISKSKKNGQCFVTLTGKNGRKLAHSETFKTKRSAWTNIAAMSALFNSHVLFRVQDNTKQPAKVYTFSHGGVKQLTNIKPVKFK